MPGILRLSISKRCGVSIRQSSLQSAVRLFRILKPIPVSYTHLDVYKRQVVAVVLGDDAAALGVALHGHVIGHGVAANDGRAEMCIRDRSISTPRNIS